MKPAYYNEFNKYAAEWLRNLIAAGHIAPGDVDERDIRDVRPDDLRGYSQCHFFAGIGVWSYALCRAGWSDDRSVWTGSCPCQPFSAAGAGLGFADERHLWPHFHWLIQECRPATILGEQVASKDADPWIDLVQADLEGLGYAFGCVPFPSASVGAPHIRDRNFWVANAGGQRVRTTRHGTARSAPRTLGCPAGEQRIRPDPWTGGAASGGLADSHSRTRGKGSSDLRGRAEGSDAQSRAGSGSGSLPSGLGDTIGTGLAQRFGISGVPGGASGADQRETAVGAGIHPCGLADMHGERCGEARSGELPGERAERIECCGDTGRAGPVNGFWRAADFLLCRDGKWRPVEPGTFPLAYGAAGSVGRVRTDQERLAAILPRKDQGSRVGRLHGYGNAINAEEARIFIEEVMGELA